MLKKLTSLLLSLLLCLSLMPGQTRAACEPDPAYAHDLALEKKYKDAICYAEKCREAGNANGYYNFLPECMAIMGECYFFLGPDPGCL